MAVKLSVVVPFYNVEDYLEECLASLARQSLRDLEVIMVDDGSPDGSAVIAKAFARDDARFRLVQQENQGLGPARNVGAAHATGAYLAFADSDDVVPAHAYERMITCLEETGSDLVTGGVEILSSDGRRRAAFYGKAFASNRKRTHISRDPELLHDRTAWNKVFRRSFYERHGLAFPAGAYEDAPVAIPAHVLATSVDVLSDTIYHYRQRESGERSITQRRTEIGNMRDRVASVRNVSEFLRRHAPELKNPYDLTALDNDLMFFLDVLEDGDPAYREALCDAVSGFVDQVDPALLGRLTSVKRLKYHLVRARRTEELIKVREYERTGLPACRIEPRGLLRRRWYAGHPFQDSAELDIPSQIFDATDELTLHARVDRIAWEPRRVRLTGHAYVRGLDMELSDRIEITLRHTKTGGRIALPVVRVPRTDVTADSRQPAARYDGSGFVVEFDPARLRHVQSWQHADWELEIQVRVGGRTRRLKLDGKVSGFPSWTVWAGFLDLPGGARMQFVPSGSGVTLRVRRLGAVATGYTWDEDGLTVEGWCAGALPAGSRLTAVCRENGVNVAVDVTEIAAEEGRSGFRGRLPLERLRAALPEPVASAFHWDLWLHRDGKGRRMSVASGFAETSRSLTGWACQVTVTRYTNLTVRAVPRRLVIESSAWVSPDLLRLSGHYAGDHQITGRPAHLLLRRRRTGVQHTLPLDWDGDRFSADLPLGAVTSLAGTLPLAPGTWDLLLTDPTTSLTATLPCQASLPDGHETAGHHYRLRPSPDDGLHLAARVARPDDERGPYARRMLTERDYPAFRRLPVRDTIMFESYWGWQYSCNPKAIFEELRRRDTGYDLVWVTGDQPFRLPEGARSVQRHSRAYYEMTATARIVVNNVAQPNCYVKRPGQTYLQTWHGSPIKTIGYDMNWATLDRREQRLREFAADVAQWDLLVSQNPYSSAVMRRAFRYDGEILESGYPRNDRAHGPDRERIRAAVRARLGVPDGKRAVLYAPTWRDNLQTAHRGLARHELALDLRRAVEALGDDTVVLLRPHHLLNTGIPKGCERSIIDVGRYTDVTELYLAADALITDYSSAMCDFAGLGKPIILFTPDLAAYRDDIRGFSFDLVATPPGPILEDGDEVIDALRDLDALATHHRPTLDTFAATFCPHDDGQAATRVVNRLLTL
ncbi:hypothetical protein GCM10027589_51710 [Actinocorallia lasiicapitis]